MIEIMLNHRNREKIKHDPPARTLNSPMDEIIGKHTMMTYYLICLRKFEPIRTIQCFFLVKLELYQENMKLNLMKYYKINLTHSERDFALGQMRIQLRKLSLWVRLFRQHLRHPISSYGFPSVVFKEIQSCQAGFGRHLKLKMKIVFLKRLPLLKMISFLLAFLFIIKLKQKTAPNLFDM